MIGSWPARRWAVAAAAAVATVLVVGVPTVLVPNPWFGRTVPPTWWSLPVLLVTAALSGLVTASYVSTPTTTRTDTPSRSGLLGGFLTYLAVGCPVCNKVALLALGSAGAVQWFAPVQPALAVAGVVLLGYALRRRLAGERSCPVPAPPPPAPSHAHE
jgi:hypothetical protein